VSAELILHNAKIATNGVPSFVEAITVSGGRIAAAGTEEEISSLCGFVLNRTPIITAFQCWVILGSGIWDAIVLPFEKWQPNS